MKQAMLLHKTSLFHKRHANLGSVVISVLVLVITISFLQNATARITINEIELNPESIDANNEWIELYNDGAPTSLEGWYMQDKNDNVYALPSEIITTFFVIENLGGLTNEDQELKLFNKDNFLEDTTASFLLTDRDNDDRTWGRVPDGTDNFLFQQQTKSLPNEPTRIENLSLNKACVLETDSIKLNAQITGFCVTKVKFNVLVNNELQTFPATRVGTNNYTITLPPALLTPLQTIFWDVATEDCFTREEISSQQSFYVNHRTSLIVTPLTPDGLNNWYITEPRFQLLNPDATQLFYQWEASDIFPYVEQFGLENTPNNNSIIGGLATLKFWSDVCNEPIQQKTFKTDFTDPRIVDVYPSENAFIHDPKPKISARLDERFRSNAGFHQETITLLLDDQPLTPTIETHTNADILVSSIPETDLGEGIHTLFLNVTDNAGRYSEKTWTFTLDIPDTITLVVHTPEEKDYSTNKIPIALTTTQTASTIELYNANDKNPRFITLCRNCNEYGISKEKFRSFNEGENNVIIRATDFLGGVIEKNLRFIVESRPPLIFTTAPQSGFASDPFSIEFREENPTQLTLTYTTDTETNTQELDLGTCQRKRKHFHCSYTLDLMPFDGQTISYYYTLIDSAQNQVTSKERTLKVDLTPPVINMIEVIPNRNGIELILDISEDNLAEVTYINQNERDPEERSFCTKLKNGRCKKRFSLTTGRYLFEVMVADKAGNAIAQEVEIII